MARSRWEANQRDLYDELSSTWWSESGLLHALGILLAPVRVPFVVEVLRGELGHGVHRVLDLGAGGGLLAEALDSAGFSVVALDPSVLSLQSGREHGALTGSLVRYVGGIGEQLPFTGASFDAVVCMEVLEHVEDPSEIVASAARVLRPGGVFIFSGPNRTVINRIGLVFVAQHLLGLVPRGTHQSKRFVRPGEVEHHMRASGIEPALTLGVGLRVRSIPRAAWAVIGLLIGRNTHPEAARQIQLATGTRQSIAYQGFGIRR